VSEVHAVIVPVQLGVQVHPVCVWQVVCVASKPHAVDVPEHVDDVLFQVHPAIAWQADIVVWLQTPVAVPEHVPEAVHPGQLLQPRAVPQLEQV
jgi:hypothetical protein